MNVRDKIAAQDLILRALAELENKTAATGNVAVAEAISAERERLAKKWGVS